MELIFSDVWGPAFPSIGGFKYYVSFIDDYNKFTWIYFLKKKSDVEQISFQFQKHVELMLGSKICAIQTDWGGEYRKLHKIFSHVGIDHRVSCPHTHQQNGSTERMHRYIVETGLALLAQSHMPIHFWHDAFHIACFLINRMPS